MPTDALDAAELKLARTSPFHSIDWRFGVILGVSVVTHVAFALHLNAQPLPAWSEIVEPELPRGTVRLPPKLPIPKPPPVAQAPQHGGATHKPSAEPSKAGANLARYGTLAILTAHGAGDGFDDVLDRAHGADMKEAFEHASALKVASLENLPANLRGPREGKAETIGHFGADRVGEVRYGEHQDSLVTSQVVEEPPEPKPGIDPTAVGHFLAARRRAVQLCYEHELKRLPHLAGRLVVRMTVTPTGRTREVEVEENGLRNDAVAQCVTTLIRGWTFPVRPADDWEFSIPYIFSAGT